MRAVLVICLLFALSGCRKENNFCCDENQCCISSPIQSGDFTTPEKIQCLSERIDSISEKNVHGVYGGKNPPHLDDSGIFLNANVLYWRATEDGLEYADIFEENPHLVFKERIRTPKGKWNTGFRLGTGYLFGDFDAWDLNFNWTYYKNDSDDTTKNTLADHFKIVVPLWGGNLLGHNLLDSFARWKIRFNCFDLDLGRNYFVSKALALHPYVGIRGALIHQNYDMVNIADYSAPAGLAIIFPSSFDAFNDFHGVGLNLGAKFLWHLGCHFGFLGKLSGALLYGQHKVVENFNGNFTESPPAVPFDFHSSYQLHRLQPNLESALGIQWEAPIFRGRCILTLGASYEFSVWFSQGQFTRIAVDGETDSFTPTINEDRDPADLSFNGYTFSLRLDF